jgi:hypothetical protein
MNFEPAVLAGHRCRSIPQGRTKAESQPLKTGALAMKTFRDTTGREWAITIDVNSVKRVMKSTFDYMGESLKINLLSLVEPDSDLLKKVIAYPPLVCDIAYAICKPQCDEKNVGDEDFGRSMGGDVLEKVLDCILEETIDFFPLARRTVLRKVLEKSQTFAEKAKVLMAARLAAGDLDVAIDAILEPELQELQKLPMPRPNNGTGSASSWQESSGSILGQEPSLS